MKHWVRLARTTERNGWESVEPMIGKLKARMLTGDEQSRRLAMVGEGMSDRA